MNQIGPLELGAIKRQMKNFITAKDDLNDRAARLRLQLRMEFSQKPGMSDLTSAQLTTLIQEAVAELFLEAVR